MLWQRLIKALSGRTARNVQLAFGGQLGNAGLGYLSNLILIHALPVADYGRYSLLLSLILFVAGLAHFGWLETVVRFTAEAYGRNAVEEASRIRRWIGRRVGFLTAVSCLALVVLAPFLARRVYRREDLTAWIACAAAGVGLTVAANWKFSKLRARQEFGRHSAILTISSAIRLAVFSLVVALGFTHAAAIFGVYLASLALTALILILNDPRSGACPAPLTANDPIVIQLIGYNRWIWTSMMMTTLTGNLDTHFIAHYHSDETVAVFTTANRLTLPFLYVINALTLVLLPRLSASQDPSDLSRYLKRLAVLIPPLLGLGAICAVFAPQILAVLAGPSYLSASPLFRMQMAATSIVLLTNPLGLALYARGRTRLLAIMNALQLIVSVTLNFLWIPRFQAFGALASTLVVNSIGFFTTIFAVGMILRKEKSSQHAR